MSLCVRHRGNPYVLSVLSSSPPSLAHPCWAPQSFALVLQLKASRGTRAVVLRTIEPVSVLVSATALGRARDLLASLPILQAAIRALKPEVVVGGVTGSPPRCAALPDSQASLPPPFPLPPPCLPASLPPSLPASLPPCHPPSPTHRHPFPSPSLPPIPPRNSCALWAPPRTLLPFIISSPIARGDPNMCACTHVLSARSRPVLRVLSHNPSGRLWEGRDPLQRRPHPHPPRSPRCPRAPPLAASGTRRTCLRGWFAWSARPTFGTSQACRCVELPPPLIRPCPSLSGPLSLAVRPSPFHVPARQKC